VTIGDSSYGPLDFARDSEVPRETLERLTKFAQLLTERNAHLNLVADSTLPDMWRRHFLDSAQLAALIPAGARSLVDLGSGAGFPGMVLAIMLSSGTPSLTVHLVEATQKKCRFLEEVAEATGTRVEVHWARSDDLVDLKADVVTARALAPLPKLLGLAFPFFTDTSTGLFLKGRSLDAELTEACESWKLQAERLPSRSDPSGSILRVTGLSPWRKPRKPS
jgi:16S rRNA (guanine527-N7)-methyltransferase